MSVILGRLSGAFLLNCELFALTLLFALPLGLVVSFGSMSRCKPLSAAVKTFVWIIRGTPLMLQIIVIYLGPGLLGMSNPWPSGSGGRMVAAVVAFAINYACYFSEIYRGGIEAVPKGQTEAGEVLGMTKTQIFFKVTLLQVIKRILPPMVSGRSGCTDCCAIIAVTIRILPDPEIHSLYVSYRQYIAGG